MIIGDKKKAITLILSKMKPDGAVEESHVAHEEGEIDEYTSFAEDIMAAIENKSVKGLASCLKAFHEMIEVEDQEQDMEV